MSTNLSAIDTDFVRELVYKRAAIVLDDTKLYLIESRLEQVAATTQCGSAAEVVRLARVGGPMSAAQTRIVEAITTHETTFFRDIQPFDALRRELLPALLTKPLGRPITLWSAACSTGQEPYSLAMMLCEAFPHLPPSTFRIVATDLSHAVIERAREGKYRQMEMNRGLPATYTIRYFDRVGSNWQVKQQIRDMVSFSQMNLLDAWNGVPAADIVFMRYVLIYFDTQTKRKILERLRGWLPLDASLFLGATETTLNVHEGFDRIPYEKTSYYRVRP